MNKIAFTKTIIEKLPIPDIDRVTYLDTKLPGLQLRVSSKGKKTFGLRSSLNGKTVRVTLGSFPKITVDEARKLAKKQHSILADGKNPNVAKKAAISKAITLQQCLDQYIQSRTNLKASTAQSYRNMLDKYLSDWLSKPLTEISRDKIESRHRKIGAETPTSANKVMRVIRALFEYAHGKYEDENGDPIIIHNPVKRLTHTKAWYKEKKRTTFIKPNDLKAWFKTVDTANDWMDAPDPQLISDYVKLILFTGLRRREADCIKWSWIDFENKSLTIPETKNGHEHTLPLTNYLYDLLKSREKNNSEFVFQGKGASGHLSEPKKSIVNIRDKSKVHFTLHDLRRTFATIAESLGIREYTLKRLLNHRNSGDVTDGYIMSDVDRLREPMQKITDFILLKVKQK